MGDKPTNDKKLKVSTAADVKKQRGSRDTAKAIELPSGLVFEVKRPAIKILLAKGKVPDALASKIINMQGAGTGNVRPKDLPDMIEFQKVVAANAIVNPTVADNPDPAKGEISKEDIDPDDLDVIFGYVMTGEARPDVVDSFRGNAGGLPTGSSVPPVSGETT